MHGGHYLADTSKLNRLVGYVPDTSLQEGLRRSFEWLKSL